MDSVTIPEWREIGREAAREGRMRTPSHDPRIAAMLDAEPCEMWSETSARHVAVMEAWLLGYDDELARQIEQT